jgi:hypothetical protein
MVIFCRLLFVDAELGRHVRINNDCVQFTCNKNADHEAISQPNEHDQIQLDNRTKRFMKQFAIRSIVMQKPAEQLAILQAHAATVAFVATKHNSYIVATKSADMNSLMSKLKQNNSTAEKCNVNAANVESQAESSTGGHCKADKNKYAWEFSCFYCSMHFFFKNEQNDSPVSSQSSAKEWSQVVVTYMYMLLSFLHSKIESYRCTFVVDLGQSMM